jgi:hypothetical protein
MPQRVPAFALLLTTAFAGLSCGDGPLDPLDDPLGAAIVTLSGVLNQTDTTSALLIPSPQYDFLDSLRVFSLDLGFAPRIGRDTVRLRGTELPLPFYIILLRVAGSGNARAGSFAIGEGVEGMVMDSLAMDQLSTLFADFEPGEELPPSMMLEAYAGTIDLDHVTDSIVTGSFRFDARDETGRELAATGQFRAVVPPLPHDSLGRGTISFPFLPPPGFGPGRRGGTRLPGT